MSDKEVRDAERKFDLGIISRAQLNIILQHNGRELAKPRLDYQDYCHFTLPGEENEDRWVGDSLDSLYTFLREPAHVIAAESVGSYQGTHYAILAVYSGPQSSYALWTDYYGSCSGCDAYIDAEPQECFEMTKGTLRNIRKFWSLDEIEDAIEAMKKDAANYSFWGFPEELVDKARTWEAKRWTY